MSEVQELFTDRELAALLWCLVALAWAMSKPKIRSSLANLLRSFFKLKVLSVNLGLCIYIVVLVLALRRVHLWDISLLKDTLLWIAGGGIVTLLSVGTAEDPSAGFRRVAAEIFTVAVAIEFLANLYSFPLWAEVLALPTLVLAVGMRTLADYQSDFDILKKPLDWLVAIYGLAVLGISLHGLFTELHAFLTLATLRAFLLPIVLSAVALPYFYLVLLVMQYEMAFLRLRWTIDDPKLRSFAKRALLRKFHFRLSTLQKWQLALGMRSVETKAEFLQLLHRAPSP